LLIQFKIPKSLAITQSEVFKRRKAREKLTIIVVKVKNKLGSACLKFL